MLDQVRKDIVKLIYEKQEAHLGSCLSCVEIIQAIKEVMKPGDKFILSKTHATRALDVIGRPEGFVKELDCYGGSLGNGIGIGLGIALSLPSSTVYVLVGDGELDEGSNWEAIRYSGFNHVKNLVIIVDYNGWTSYKKSSPAKDMTIFEFHNEIVPAYPLEIRKDEIKKVLLQNTYYPKFIYCQTNKGEGIPELQDKLESHYHKVSKEEMEKWVGK